MIQKYSTLVDCGSSPASLNLGVGCDHVLTSLDVLHAVTVDTMMLDYDAWYESHISMVFLFINLGPRFHQVASGLCSVSDVHAR